MPSVLDTPGVLNTPSVTAPLQVPPIPDKRPIMERSRRFGDPTAIRQMIFDNALNAAKSLEPVSNSRYTLSLSKVGYDSAKPYSIAQQKKAILNGQTLAHRLRGTWNLKDNSTGKLVSSKRATVANVPFFTRRGTIVHNGNEYTIAHQMRLKSGIFSRIREDGQLASHVNIMPGKGISHHLSMDPETGIFRIEIGQARIPLISLLQSMGVSEKRIREAWGNDLTAVNLHKANAADIDKLYMRAIRAKDRDGESGLSKKEAVAAAFNAMELDPSVTKHTLGKAFDRVSPESILATTRKLLAIRRKDDPEYLAKLGLEPADVDDRDSLAYMHLHGPEDLLSERIRKSKPLLNQLLWRATARGNVDRLQPGLFDKPMYTAIFGSGLGSPIESINPAQIYEQQVRVSRLGEGGIPSTRAIPESARNVQSSHMGFIDPLITPESSRAGVDLRFARNTRKGEDGKLYSQFRNVRTGRLDWKAPDELTDATIALPGELKRGRPRVVAISGGKTKFVLREDVDFELPHFENAMSAMSNLVPMKSAIKGQRASMGARMSTQALPLIQAEAPLVQSGVPGEDQSFEELYGTKMGAIFADSAGRVTKVTDDEIHVRYADGKTDKIEVYNNFPYNRKTYIHQTPAVAVGQVFKQGDILARSNYTDQDGTTALGLNARVAYLPFRGLNFEDAVVVSESFSKRLTSQHMYQEKTELDKKLDRTDRNVFIGLFPSEYESRALKSLNDDGIIKEGTTVQYGDPLVLVARERERTANQVHRGRRPTFVNKSVTWDHHAAGVVTDVARRGRRISVSVKSTNPAKVGDKLSGRYGDKGVIAEIIPDDEMPVDAQGKSIELLLNPLGIISRTNPAQIVEAALGKIAAVTGKPYRIHDFEDIEDLTEYAIAELKKHGMSDLESVTDPTTERKINDVLVGNRFIMKLHHTAESKGAGRSVGGYTMEGAPARGGPEGSKSLGMLDINALLSHGATEVIRDAKLIRGQRNPEYWSAFMSGFKPANPKVPLVYTKFVNQLQAAGINPVRTGTRMHVMAMTNADVTRLSGTREIQNADTVDWKQGLKPRKGGLFDEGLTGGHNGTRWSHIKLHEPMLNPVMEEPTRILLGLTKPKFVKIMKGDDEFQGARGPGAIAGALKRLDITKEISRARADIKSGRKTYRDSAVRRLRYLKAAKKTKLHPGEWILDRVPVLPPIFRPITTMMGSDMRIVSDSNYLYKELFDSNKNLKELSSKVADVGDERIALYNSFKAVVGLGDPLGSELRDRKVKGLLAHIFGSSPKYGVVQRRLLGSTVDVVGRAAITPNPDLDMDEVALPEDKAWDVYRPFTIRHLVRKGMPRLQAARIVKDRTDAARKALLDVMKDRPIIYNRAPVLHRYGMMAAFPRLTKGDTMQVSPLIVGGFGADFDGDAMQYHVPVSEEARREAIDKMLPSRNLLSAAHFDVHFKPSQEYLGGLYSASSRVDRKRPARTFETRGDAIRAYRRGEIGVGQRITILK